ncbi:WAS/WASL-interacting protein family member 2 [Gracilaria domingensis]|nr:WAS/WASL-interacting protein family member 2 [Gracilaria domingensis]
MGESDDADETRSAGCFCADEGFLRGGCTPYRRQIRASVAGVSVEADQKAEAEGMLVTTLNACARAYEAARQTRRQRRRRGARRATFRRRHASWECRAAPQRDVGTAWRRPGAVVERVRVGDLAERGGLAHATGRAQAHDLPARDAQRHRALARAAHERGADGIDVQQGGGGGGSGGSEKRRAPHITSRARRAVRRRSTAVPASAQQVRVDQPAGGAKDSRGTEARRRRTQNGRSAAKLGRSGGAWTWVTTPTKSAAVAAAAAAGAARKEAERWGRWPRPRRLAVGRRRRSRALAQLRGGGGFAALHGRLHGDDAAPGDGDRNLTEGRQRSGVAQLRRKLHNLKLRTPIPRRAAPPVAARLGAAGMKETRGVGATRGRWGRRSGDRGGKGALAGLRRRGMEAGPQTPKKTGDRRRWRRRGGARAWRNYRRAHSANIAGSAPQFSARALLRAYAQNMFAGCSVRRDGGGDPGGGCGGRERAAVLPPALATKSQ